MSGRPQPPADQADPAGRPATQADRAGRPAAQAEPGWRRLPDDLGWRRLLAAARRSLERTGGRLDVAVTLTAPTDDERVVIIGVSGAHRSAGSAAQRAARRRGRPASSGPRGGPARPALRDGPAAQPARRGKA